MCDSCKESATLGEEWKAEFRERMEDNLLAAEIITAKISLLDPHHQQMAKSILNQLQQVYDLSPKQWRWLKEQAGGVSEASRLQGDFKKIFVMFQIAGEVNGLKFPKIRLITQDGEYLTLVFSADYNGRARIFAGGVSSHGSKRYVGSISPDYITPVRAGAITSEMLEVIQQLATDPVQTVKAMAAQMGICSFCGSPLSDEPSKEAGYGPVCAKTYQLPWGGKEPVNTNALLDQLAAI